MKAIIDDFHTDIILSKDEIKEYCKIGEGSNCCVWLMAGPKGFVCSFHNKNYSLLKKWQDGETTAKRDGCEKVKNFNPFGLGIGETEF